MYTIRYPSIKTIIKCPVRRGCDQVYKLPNQPPPQALRFSHGRGEREMTGDEPQGTMGSAHIFRETSGYEAVAKWCLLIWLYGVFQKVEKW